MLSDTPEYDCAKRLAMSCVSNAVCFLTDTVSAPQLEMLVALLDTKHCELVL
jgi:hypothetical protein